MPTLNQHHERRLLDETALIKARLRRLARHYGASGLSDDREAHRINFEGAFDIVGLVALQARTRSWTATLISAPGIYMHPARRHALASLVAESNARGVRTVLVFKRSLLWRARRLESAVMASSTMPCSSRRLPVGVMAIEDNARRRIAADAPSASISQCLTAAISSATDVGDAAAV